MKTLINVTTGVLILILLFILYRRMVPGEQLPHGSWQMIKTISVENGRSQVTYPGINVGKEFKVWSGKNFIFFGRWEKEKVITDNYGYGTYTLDGNQYEETVLYHFMPSYQGQKIRMTLEFRNDTLTQIYHPVDSAGKPIESRSSIEKFIRLK